MELNPVLNGHILPRIYSHTKLALRHTSHAKTIQEQSNQTGTLKRSASAIPNRNLHSANTSKAIKLQTTTAVFHNKAEQLQRLQNSLNKQIQSIKAEIAKLRIKKKGAQDTVSVISSRISSVVPEQGRNKTDALRRRLDKQRERAKKTMTEVQNVRKDILTTKKLNTQIAEEIQSWEKQLSAEIAVASKLDEILALKTTQVQKKKVEMVHQKAKIIKQYDAIRHKLDNELNSQGGKSNAAYFYLTDLTSAEVIQKKRSQLLVENSPKGHKVGNRAEYFKEKMDEWKGQTETIKEKVNAKSLEEAEQKLMEIHENNYHHYKFINQRHAALQELKQRNSQLKQQKSSLMREIVEKEHSHTTQAITTTKSKIRKTQETQKELKDKIAESQQIYQRTKSFICEFIRQSGLVLPVQETAVTIQQQVNKTTLSAFLQSLLQLKQRGFKPSENAHSQ